ncbi:MAG: hypothetical protein K1060chlam5_00417 [Candidatus Anoxychlamydiales bacterium]|nr:hypothetical protein [Candidatus Anoxychlamydiales bacterium]
MSSTHVKATQITEKTWIDSLSIDKDDKTVTKIMKYAVIILSLGTVYIIALALDIRTKITSFISKEDHLKKVETEKTDSKKTKSKDKVQKESSQTLDEDEDYDDLSFSEKATLKFNKIKVLVIKDKKPILCAISFSFAYYMLGVPGAIFCATYYGVKKLDN